MLKFAKLQHQQKLSNRILTYDVSGPKVPDKSHGFQPLTCQG
jgi:hypothetical protein